MTVHDDAIDAKRLKEHKHANKTQTITTCHMEVRGKNVRSSLLAINQRHLHFNGIQLVFLPHSISRLQGGGGLMANCNTHAQKIAQHRPNCKQIKDVVDRVRGRHL